MKVKKKILRKSQPDFRRCIKKIVAQVKHRFLIKEKRVLVKPKEPFLKE